MSNILKGILNETSPHNYDSDWDYQDAVARSGKSRSSYRSQEDDTFDDDVAYSRKMYQLGQQQKAAKEKAQRDADHDRLATGTNEGITENDRINPIGSFPKGPKANRPNRPPLRTSAEMADMLNVDIYKFSRLAKIFPNFPKPVEGIRATNGSKLYYNVQEFNKWVKDNDILNFLKQNVGESLDDPWGDQGNFAGDKPFNLGGVSIKNIQTGDTVKYLEQPAKVVAMSKDRKYSRITISKGMGGVTQDVLTSDLQQLGRGTAIEEDDKTQNRMRMNDYYDLADAIQEKLRHAIQSGNNELAQKLNKERDDLDARVKQYGLIPEDVAEGSKKEEEYGPEWDEKVKRIGQMAKEGPRKTVWDPVKRVYKTVPVKQSGIKQGINELSPGPTGPKGPKDYGQPNSSRYIGGNKFVVGTTNNYVLTATIDKWGLEWDEDDEIWFLDSPGAAHIADASEGEIELPPPREQRNQIHDLVTDYLNARNSADLQKVAAYYGHSDDGEMATNESIAEDRFNSKQEVINHFVKNGKSAAAGAAAWERGYRGSSPKKPIELKKPPQRNYHDELDDKRYSSNTFENLGDQLKSKSLEALTLLKQQIEQKRAEDLAQWEQDFRKNVASKMRSQSFRPPEATPVAQPGEKHSVLKARLAQLNSAIEKQALLDKLIDKLERKGLMTPAMQNDTDTRMHVKYGAKDNYQSLNKKLDNAITTLQDRLYIRKKSGLKEAQEIKFILVIDGKDKFKFPTREEALKVLNDYKAAFPKSNAKIETRAVAKTMYDEGQNLDENLHKWFKEKWVRFGPDGKIRGDCARGDDSEGKPKCLPQSKAQNLGKKGRASAASRKRREDPNPERSGKAINVNTKKKTDEEQLDELKCWSGYHRVAGTKAGFPGSCAKNKTNEEGLAEGWKEESQELEDWTKEVNMRLYKAHENQRHALARQLSKVEQKHFGSKLTNGPLTNIVFSTLQALNKGQMVHYDPQRVGQMPFGSMVGDDARILAAAGVSSDELVGYRMLSDKGIVDNIQQFLKLRRVVWNKNWPQEYLDKFAGSPGALWLQFVKDLNWSKDDMNEEVQAKTDDKLLAYYAQRKAEKEKQQGVAEEQHSCPHCGGEMVSEELMNEKKDACYYKVKSRYKVWPSAYASGALVKCRKSGADSWGNGGKKNESIEEDQLDEKWTKKYKDSINCSNPKGFSQKAHCAGKQKNESSILQGIKKV